MGKTTYSEAVSRRNEIININRSRRMRNHSLPKNEQLELMPVPPLPEMPLVPVAYERDGGKLSYVGWLPEGPGQCPAGCVIRWERMDVDYQGPGKGEQ